MGEEEINCLHIGGLQKNSRIPTIISCLETMFHKCLCLLAFLSHEMPFLPHDFMLRDYREGVVVYSVLQKQTKPTTIYFFQT